MAPEEKVAAIKNLKLEDARAFYEKFYGASDATIAIVGDFGQEEVEAALNRNFGAWESPGPYERLADEFYQPEPAKVELETPDKSNAVFLAAQNLKLNEDHPDYPAMLLGNFMLGGGFLNSRLATRIRQKEGLSYSVRSSFFADSRDETASWRTYAIYAPENAEALEKAFREEIEKACREGFTAEEVAAAKSGWIQSRQVNRAQDNALSATLNSYLDLDRTMEWDAALEAKIQALTPGQINATMAKYLDLDKMVIVKAGDFAKVREAKP